MNWSTLGAECQIVGGGTPSRERPDFFGGPIPWATPSDVTRLNGGQSLSSTKETITEQGLSRSSAKVLPAGTVLLTSRATIGFTAVAAVPMATNQGFANLICGPRLLPEFLAVWLPTQRDLLLQLAGGTTFKEISKSTLKGVRVPVPSIGQQHRIVDLLSHAASLKRLAKEAQATTRELIPALFVDMFGDPSTNSKGWTVVHVGEVATVSSGAGFPKAEQGKVDEQYPFLKVSDMNLPGNGRRIRTWNNSIDEETRQRLRARAFSAGAVIFPKIGAAIATNKKRVLERASCVDNNVMAVSPGERLSSAYLYGLFLLKDISDFASKSDLPSMRQSDVEGWAVPLPPFEVQTEFERRLAIVESIEQLTAQAHDTAERTSAALMSRLFAT